MSRLGSGEKSDSYPARLSARMHPKHVLITSSAQFAMASLFNALLQLSRDREASSRAHATDSDAMPAAVYTKTYKGDQRTQSGRGGFGGRRPAIGSISGASVSRVSEDVRPPS